MKKTIRIIYTYYF